MFSIHHLFYVLSAVLTFVVVLRFANTLRNSRHERTVKRAVFVLLIVFEVFYHIHNWSYPRFSIPLHICGFAVVMSLFMLKSDSQKLFDFLFFFGILGGIMALVFPNSWGYTYRNIRYYHFLILHNILIAIPLYYYKAYGYRVTYRTLWNVYKTVLVLAIFVHLLNLSFQHFGYDSNYWFITYVPAVVEDYFPSYPLYIVTYLGLVLLVMHVLFYATHKDAWPIKNKKNHSSE